MLTCMSFVSQQFLFRIPLFVPWQVSLQLPLVGPTKRVNINLARIKVLINCEPSKLRSTRGIHGGNVSEGPPRARAL